MGDAPGVVELVVFAGLVDCDKASAAKQNIIRALVRSLNICTLVDLEALIVAEKGFASLI